MNKILVIAPSWVGDMVMAKALLQALKKNDSSIVLHVVAQTHLIPLINKMPEVEKTLTLPLKHGEFNLRERFLFGKNLIAEHYDKAIVLPNSWKSALIPFFARIPKRTGWLGEMRYVLLNDWRILDAKKIPLMVERFVALGFPQGKYILGSYSEPRFVVSKEEAEKTLAKLNLEKPKNPILALCVGAEYGPAKRWPAKYFAEVAKAKKLQGFDVWLFGGKKDQEVAAEVQKNCDNICLDLTGKTDLGEVVDLLSLASFVITNDTGLMHVAAALDVPLLALYGSSSPGFTPPLSQKAKILSLNLSCSPCFERECPAKHFKCMNDLTPEMVLKQINVVD